MDTATAAPATAEPTPATRPPDWALARELHRQGLSWAQIADKASVPLQACRHRARDERWLRARDAVIVLRHDDGPPAGILPSDVARKSDRLRCLLIDDTLAAVQRVTMREAPRNDAKERERAELTRLLTAQAEAVCGWSRQDQTSGAILVGFASQVLGDSKAIAGPDGAQVHDGQVQTGTGAG